MIPWDLYAPQEPTWLARLVAGHIRRGDVELARVCGGRRHWPSADQQIIRRACNVCMARFGLAPTPESFQYASKMHRRPLPHV